MTWRREGRAEQWLGNAPIWSGWRSSDEESTIHLRLVGDVLATLQLRVEVAMTRI